MTTKKGHQLEFISRINRDGSGTEKPKQSYIDLMQDDNFKINCLSMTEKTFIASGMSSFVVKLKPEPLKKDKSEIARDVLKKHFETYSGAIETSPQGIINAMIEFETLCNATEK